MLTTLILSVSVMLAQETPAQFARVADSAQVTVRALNDSIPLESVLIAAGIVRARTDRNGVAVLRLAAGTHTVRASRLGLRPDSIVVVLAPDTDTIVTMRLEAAELEAVVISATRSERRIEDDPLRVEVLDQEEVEEKLRMTPGDITMMLNESSGLRVQTTSPSLGGASVRVQGLRGRYTQLLSDGLPLYGGQTGAMGLLQIPPMDLGGVEVIKGVASALYGGSALGGVINLISRRPASEPQLDILANATTSRGADLVGFASRMIGDRFGYTALAGGHRQDAVDIDDDGWIDLAGYERLVLRPRGFWTHPAGHTVVVTAGTTLEQREGGTEEGSTTPDGSFYPERLRTRRFDAGAIGRYLTGRTILSMRGSASTQEHRHTFGPSLERDNHLTWFAEAAATVTRGTAVWVAGAALQQEHYRNDDVAAFDFTFNTPAAFAQVTADLTDRLSLTTSARLEHHSEYGAQFAPRISSLFRLTPSWTLRASGGGGYFAPTPFTEETEVTGLRVLAPFSRLEIERARSGSLDLGGQLGPVEINSTLFASFISNPIAVRAVTADRSRISLVNAPGETRTAGGELLVRWNPEPYHVTASYTFVRSSEADPDNAIRRDVPLTPRHQAGVVGSWEQEDKARAGIEIYFTGRQSLEDNPYRQTSRAFVHVGAMAEKRFGRFRIFLNGENLLGFRQTNYDRLVLPERGLGGRWTTDVWGPLEGRVANLGVRFD